MTNERIEVANSPRIEWLAGKLYGLELRRSVKKVSQLTGLFRDQAAVHLMDQESLVYQVEWWEPEALGTEGGLLWGSTTIQPGLVGDEYFMTHGHFHAIRNRAEYYYTIKGEGLLLLMDEDRKTTVEVMSPGSIHYIPGGLAHRAVNTGNVAFSFWACWPTDAGHDYKSIDAHGFSVRVQLRNGRPEVVPEGARDGGYAK
jgi:glucose-6-phosphate isomerase, archaeal